MASNEPPLDEIQWRHPQLAAMMQGIHSNSVLFYFAESPFFDRTSNNATVANQAMFNLAMRQYIETREAFEARLRTMSGIEYIVSQEPSSMAPGTGTGVWVIRKQMRRKRDGLEDEVMPLASYYVVGDNIYMAPTLADILSFRMVNAPCPFRYDGTVMTSTFTALRAYTIILDYSDICFSQMLPGRRRGADMVARIWPQLQAAAQLHQPARTHPRLQGSNSDA